MLYIIKPPLAVGYGGIGVSVRACAPPRPPCLSLDPAPWSLVARGSRSGTAERERSTAPRSYTRGSEVGDRCRPSLKP